MVGVVEYGYTSLNKFGEELCGDKVETCVADGWTTLVLADGLGSGVKANILSTLTSKILCTMVANNIPMQDCMETIIDSLPICKVRGVAYSTFSLGHVTEQGQGYLIEFDNPQAIYIRDGKTCDLIKCQMDICGKRVYHSRLAMQEGDSLVVTSDGTIHAGVGMILNFG
ncbi:MAG: SpoIIE family protein phosphatase, partial [Rikenellaceae bacterium]|nr:SpoIIE family protein phosphatase [Rikenellaceae bacterium]